MYYMFWKDWIRHKGTNLENAKVLVHVCKYLSYILPWFAKIIGTSNSKKSKRWGGGAENVCM